MGNKMNSPRKPSRLQHTKDGGRQAGGLGEGRVCLGTGPLGGESIHLGGGEPVSRRGLRRPGEKDVQKQVVGARETVSRSAFISFLDLLHPATCYNCAFLNLTSALLGRLP